MNEEEKKVYFSVWTDLKLKEGGTTAYVFQRPRWGIDANGSVSAARKDHDEKFALVFDKGYEAYGYFIEADDPKADPRAIAETRTGFIFSFDLRREADGTVLGTPKTRINIR